MSTPSSRAVAYIPAKGTSRGIPQKNIALIDGHPLLEYSIRTALQSLAFDAVFVSTESEQVSQIAISCGARVLARPLALAADRVRVAEVLMHDLDKIERATSPAPELIACLLPTSPFRSAGDLHRALNLARENPEAPTVVSLGKLPCPIEQVVCLDEEQSRIEPHAKSYNLTARSQRQSYRQCYYPNGAICVARMGLFRTQPVFYVENRSIGMPMDSVRGFDIDSLDDLEHARLIARGLSRSWPDN